MNRYEMNKVIAVNLFGKKEGVDFGSFESHKLQTDSKGEPDDTAFMYDHHYGYICERCSESFCVGCEDSTDTECIVEPYDYCTNSGYSRVLYTISKQYIVKFTIDTDRVLCQIGYTEPLDGKYYVKFEASSDNIPEALCKAVIQSFGN